MDGKCCITPHPAHEVTKSFTIHLSLNLPIKAGLCQYARITLTGQDSRHVKQAYP